MDKLPDELLNNIFYNLLDQEPDKIYILRGINKKFKFLVDNIENNYDNNYNEIKIGNIINHLLYKDKEWNIKTFNWLFKNNIIITFNNITNMIKNNRLDVLKESNKYINNNKVIFDNDRYNILSFGDNVRLIKDNSPLIIAGIDNNKNIIDFLLSNKSLKNPFIRQIDILVDVLIDLNNKDLIKHLFISYYDKMIGKQLTSLKVLKNMSNCEDLILYLLDNGKICINNDMLLTSITKNYTKVSLIAYDTMGDRLLIPNEHIHKILSRNNLSLLSFFINKYPHYFYIILDYIRYTIVSKEIFMYIYNNYLKWIDNDYPLIEIYLHYDDNINNIKLLVNNNYIITKKSIIDSLEFDNKEIFRLLSKKY